MVGHISLEDAILVRIQARQPRKVASPPWQLMYAEAYIDKRDALGRGKFLKSGSGRRFLKKQLTHYLTRDR